MSGKTQAIIGAHERVAYTVEHRGNCVLIDGPVPASAFPILSKLVPEDSVMDTDAARVLGVTFAFGPEGELTALREAHANAAASRSKRLHPNISPQAAEWLANGERGTSSNAIFSHLTGIDATGFHGFDTPYDPADFRRCRLLLERVPELVPLLPAMRSVSPAWSCLVDEWDKISETMDAEAPDWRIRKGQSAPATYQLIKRAIGR